MDFTKIILQQLRGLSRRERIFSGIALCAVFSYLLFLGAEVLNEHITETKRLIIIRTRALEDLSRVLRRYQVLQDRLTKVQTTFAESEMTFEQVTRQLDKIVQDSIGSNNYDLKKGRSPSQIGFDYEKQEFTLNVNSLSLDQFSRLLYSLENGESPLFLGKVDIVKKSSDDKTFNATLEIFSVRRGSSSA